MLQQDDLNGALVQSIEDGDADAVEQLLVHGASPNAFRLVDTINECYFTHNPLWIAYKKGYITVFELLLKYGADPDYYDSKRGDLPILHNIAMCIGDFSIRTLRSNNLKVEMQFHFLELLFKYGGVDFKELGATSPLSTAISQRKNSLLPMLFGARLFLHWQTLPVEERLVIYSELRELAKTAPDKIPSLESDELVRSKAALTEVYKPYPDTECTPQATKMLLCRAFKLMPPPSHFAVFPDCKNYTEVRMNLKGTLRFLGNMSRVCKAFHTDICSLGTFCFPFGDSELPKEIGIVIMTTAYNMACCPINFGEVFVFVGSIEKKVDTALNMIEKAHSDEQAKALGI